ncbi:MAG: hypothetical protein F4W93_04225 [Dehalococcoidia bacterium]|nr:hypothetical protein [Dehalococcoidia bacterium]
MKENPDWEADQRRLEEGVQRYEARLAEAERAGVNAHGVHARGIGRVRSLVLAVFTAAVVVGVIVAVYVLVSGTATEEPPFLQCETPEDCPAPLE